MLSKENCRLIIGVLFAFAVVAGPANAIPVINPANNHYYEYVPSSLLWSEANTNAMARTHLGEAGYLATVTSTPENNFLLSLASDGWLGGTDQVLEGDWKWFGGPEAGTTFWLGGPGGSSPTFANWGLGEPNDQHAPSLPLSEDFLTLSGHGFGQWNDKASVTTRVGFFVEFNEPDTGPPPGGGVIPEPGTMFLFGSGLIALAGVRRKHKK